MDKFLIVPNMLKDKDLNITRKIINFIEKSGKCPYLFENVAKKLKREDLIVYHNCTKMKEIHCAIVLGGDGTILNTSRELINLSIPLLGVNLGRLGYLAEVEKSDANKALIKLFNDDYKVEERMMIESRIIREKGIETVDTALNDAVLRRGSLLKMLKLSVSINDQHMDTFMADGIIISTPTGSTAYNLSAGGPIISPRAENIVITPICPHSVNIRPIVVSSKDEISLKVINYSSYIDEEIILTLDGQKAYKLDYDDVVTIKKSNYTTRLIKTNSTNFYDILREKMLMIRK